MPLFTSVSPARFFQLTALSVALALAGCGGGSDGNTVDVVDGGTNNGSDNGSDGSDDNAVVAELNVSDIVLTDTSGNVTRVVTTNGATATVTVTDEDGSAVSGALVTFSANGVTFGTTNGSVLTNSDGEASISLTPADSTDTGSYTLTATAEYEDVSATSTSYNFSLQALSIGIENLLAAETSLESGASTLLTLNTVDTEANTYLNNVTVNFSTSCGTFANDSVVSSSQGNVSNTYQAIDDNGNLCEGTQTITATTASGAVSQSIQLSIAAVAANSIVYTTTETVELGIQSSGSSATGEIEFTVYSNGTPAANQAVEIDLVRGPVDLSFITSGNRTTRTVTSDSSGVVSINLYPGNLPGPVEIKATLVSDDTISATSKNVSVASGRVSQSGLSLSMSKNSLLGNVDGDTATITARMVDRVGNAVPDGTVISFIAEGGSVGSSCATSAGACSVTFTTQNPRPTDDRVSVVAYVEGDKAFTDVDGDNMYTAGTDTLLSNIGDFFRDDNENNQFDLGEFVYERGDSGVSCANSTLRQPNVSGTCNNELDAVLRYQMFFAFADSTPTFYGLSNVNTSVSQITSSSFSFQIYGNSQRTVPMPSGTTVEISAQDNSENGWDCEASMRSGSGTLPNVMNLLTTDTFDSTSNSVVSYSVRTLECVAGDDVFITVTAPDGTIFTRALDLRY